MILFILPLSATAEDRCERMLSDADALIAKGGVGNATVAKGLYRRYETQCLGAQPQQQPQQKQVDAACVYDCSGKYTYQYCQSKCSY